MLWGFRSLMYMQYFLARYHEAILVIVIISACHKAAFMLLCELHSLRNARLT